MTTGVSTCRHCGKRIVFIPVKGKWTHRNERGQHDTCHHTVAEPIEENT